MRTTNLFLVILLVVVAFLGCETERGTFGVLNGPSYEIEAQQITDPSTWDSVIEVHGFVNNLEMADKITLCLNSTDNRYRVRQKTR